MSSFIQDGNIVEFLELQGMSVNEKTGGASSLVAEDGCVEVYGKNEYRLLFENGETIRSFSPQLFYKTVVKVEKMFNYKLFGDDCSLSQT